MIFVDAKKVVEIERVHGGKVHVTFEIDAPLKVTEEPSYPPYNHTPEDSAEAPCPACKEQAEAHLKWAKAVLDSIDNKRLYMALGVTGYSLMGQSYTSWDATGAKEADFNAWTLSIQFPNGDLGQVLLPVKYGPEFNRELSKHLNPDTVKSAWDRLLEDDK